MKIDDLVTYLVANLNGFITAQSMVTITAAQILTRNWVDPVQGVTLFLDPEPEEVEQLTMATVGVTAKVNAYWIVSRGYTEASAREATKSYMTALINCLKVHPDYFGFEARDYFDGVEGKQDVKASTATFIFKTEE